MAFLDGEDEETNDYSSYWRSIPDPPAIAVDIDVDAPVEEEIAEWAGAKRRLRDVTNRHESLNRDAAPGKPAATSSEAATVSSGSVGEEERRRKRRKKRMSLVLPSDGGGTGMLPACSTNDRSAVPSDAAASQTSNASASPSEREIVDKQTLVQLVREYTSLPPSRRLHSKAATQIESLCGYPLPDKSRPVMGSAASTKQEFLRKVQPIVMEMEQRKRLDAEEAKASTGCDAMKNGKRGYWYRDAESGAKVAAAEYKRRYGAMVDEKRQKRRNDNFRKDEEEGSSRQASVEEDGLVRMEGKNVRADLQSPCEDSNMDMDESVNMDDSRVSLDGAAACDEEGSPSDATASSPSREAHARSDSDATKDSSTAAETECHGKGGSNEMPGRSTPRPLVDGMPSSIDPRAVAAREALKRAMDAALAEYSRAILAIEAECADATTTSSNN